MLTVHQALQRVETRYPTKRMILKRNPIRCGVEEMAQIIKYAPHKPECEARQCRLRLQCSTEMGANPEEIQKVRAQLARGTVVNNGRQRSCLKEGEG